MPKAGFGVHTPALRSFASRGQARQERVSGAGGNIGSATMHGQALGQLGAGTVSHHGQVVGQAGQAANRMADRMGQSHDRLTTVASNYEGSEQDNETRFRQLHPDAPKAQDLHNATQTAKPPTAPTSNPPGRTPGGLGVGWGTYLNSWNKRNDPNAVSGSNSFGLPVKFDPTQVVSRPMYNKNGQQIGVSFAHEQSDIDADNKWAGSSNLHNRIVQTGPKQGALEALKAEQKANGTLTGAYTHAPWAPDYLAGGQGPNFMSAHGSNNKFQVRLNSGSTVDVDGATYAKIAQQSPHFQSMVQANPNGSFALLSCNVGKGSAAQDFATEMNGAYPYNMVHAGRDTVHLVNYPTAPGDVGVQNNAGWDSYYGGNKINSRPQGTR